MIETFYQEGGKEEAKGVYKTVPTHSSLKVLICFLPFFLQAYFVL